jgi:PhnB protein
VADAKRQPIVPYLTVADAASAIEFYSRAFGTVELLRVPWEGKIGHAELRLNEAVFYLSDEYPAYKAIAPSPSGSGVAIVVNVEDVDALVSRAVSHGAVLDRPIADQPHGARVAWLSDPFGHRWSFQQITEELSTEELKRRLGV